MLFLFFVVTLLALSGCAKKVSNEPKLECKSEADCKPRVCYTSSCADSKCFYSIQKNCCGNKINESIEDNRTGNKCTCPQDYGKCEGKAKTKTGYRTEDAKYLIYYCDASNECKLGFKAEDVFPQNLLDVVNTGYFRASAVITYNKPFDVKNDKFRFRITLDDAREDLIPPINLTRIRLLYSGLNARTELLIAELALDSTLNNIGDDVIVQVPLNMGFKPQDIEESGSLRYVVDYIYTKQVAAGKSASGSQLYSQDLVRTAFNSPSKQIFFITLDENV